MSSLYNNDNSNNNKSDLKIRTSFLQQQPYYYPSPDSPSTMKEQQQGKIIPK